MEHYDWKMTCLARWLIKKPDIEDRRAFLRAYEARHGNKAKLELIEYVMREWNVGGNRKK